MHVYCDYLVEIFIVGELKQLLIHKHVEIGYHYDMTMYCMVTSPHVIYSYQLVDIFTKSLINV